MGSTRRVLLLQRIGFSRIVEQKTVAPRSDTNTKLSHGIGKNAAEHQNILWLGRFHLGDFCARRAKRSLGGPTSFSLNYRMKVKMARARRRECIGSLSLFWFKLHLRNCQGRPIPSNFTFSSCRMILNRELSIS